jgi:Protein of unknown function (DUF4238)
MSAVPRKQHVVSQVLLRRFKQPVTGKLRAFDTRSGHSKLCSPAAVGYVEDYIRAEDSIEAERRWQAMEDRLPDALAAVDAGSLFELPTHVDTIRECMAVHWGRSRTVQEVDRRHRRPATEMARRELVQAREADFAREFERSRGRVAETFEDLLSVAEEMLPYDASAMERLFVSTVHENVDEALELLGQRSLAILTATGKAQFLLGDIPALTISATSGGAGPLGGVPWDEADSIVIPLGPLHLAAFGAEDGFQAANDHVVSILNKKQAAAALERIVYRPGADLDGFIADARATAR